MVRQLKIKETRLAKCGNVEIVQTGLDNSQAVKDKRNRAGKMWKQFRLG